MRIDYCDCHTDKPRPVKLLAIDEHNNVLLCRQGWQQEMQWRKEANRALAPAAQFDIVLWHQQPQLD